MHPRHSISAAKKAAKESKKNADLANKTVAGPTEPLSQEILITRQGDQVNVSYKGLVSHIDLYGLLEFAKTHVPSIKWEDAK